jgi:hypothetical protein
MYPFYELNIDKYLMTSYQGYNHSNYMILLQFLNLLFYQKNERTASSYLKFKENLTNALIKLHYIK